MQEEKKIVSLKKMAEIVEKLKKAGKTVVHCHGCFDLVHPGHIRHLRAAKKMGNTLIVTITPDIYVRKAKGEGKPIFNQDLRMENIAALQCVDFVAVNKWKGPTKTIKMLKSNIYVKGQEYKNDPEKRKALQKDLKAVKKVGAKMAFTEEIVFSSSELIKNYMKEIINVKTGL